jgi:hypothetical protein
MAASSCSFPSNGVFPFTDANNWAVRPMMLNDYFHPVYEKGVPGCIWNPNFQLDHNDNGALRVKFHSEQDGLLIMLCTGFEAGTPSIDPFHVIIDNNGVSQIHHCGRVLAQVNGARFPRGKPAWVWLTYVDGLMTVGFGRFPGENAFMQAQEQPERLFSGGYNRFAVGRTGNRGKFELLDVQPLQRRAGANVNLRGTGYDA